MPEEIQHPYFVDWAITRRCNLNCLHCRGMTEDELSLEEAQGIIEEIAALKPGWVIIEGGEPLLHPGIFTILESIRQKGLTAYLITNGTVLDKVKLAVLKQLEVKVMVSIDGATRDTFEKIRRGASFDRVVESARQCAEEGILDTINFTVSKMNYKEIPQLLTLASRLGAGKVIFIGLKPCQGYSEQVLSSDEFGEAIELAYNAMNETGMDIFFDEPFFWAVVTERGLKVPKPVTQSGIVALQTPSCIIGEYLFIEPNGDVKPCSFAPLVLGNTRQKSLGKIWEETLSSPFIQQLRDPDTRVGYCRSCVHLEECKGCRSRTVTLTGDWFSSDPACPLAPKKEV